MLFQQSFLKNRNYFIFLYSFLFVFSLEASPRLEPLPSVSIWNEVNEVEDLNTTIDAFFIASGISNADKNIYQNKIEQWIQELKVYISTAPPEMPIPEMILHFMHQPAILKRYNYKATTANELIDNGLYNCVSSAVLYLIFAKSLNLNASGVLTVDHAFILVHAADGDVDIETTNNYGYDPGSKQAFKDHFSSQTGFIYVPPGNYEDRREVSSKELIGTIFQNRIASTDYISGVETAIDYAVYQEDEWTLSLRDQAFRNLFAHYNDQKKYELGLTLIQKIKKLYPQSNLEESANALLNNQIIFLIKQNKLEEALYLLNTKMLTQYVSGILLIDLKQNVYEELIYMQLNQKDLAFNDGLNILNQAISNSYISQSRYEQYYKNLVGKEVNHLMQERNPTEAKSFFESLPSAIQEKPSYQNIYYKILENIAIFYHNNFATAVNSKQYDSAQEILQEGLAILPNHATLSHDQRTLAQFLEQR